MMNREFPKPVMWDKKINLLNLVIFTTSGGGHNRPQLSVVFIPKKWGWSESSTSECSFYPQQVGVVRILHKRVWSLSPRSGGGQNPPQVSVVFIPNKWGWSEYSTSECSLYPKEVGVARILHK